MYFIIHIDRKSWYHHSSSESQELNLDPILQAFFSCLQFPCHHVIPVWHECHRTTKVGRRPGTFNYMCIIVLQMLIHCSHDDITITFLTYDLELLTLSSLAFFMVVRSRLQNLHIHVPYM